MIIKLYNNSSPHNKLVKDITETRSMTGVLKNDTDIINPVFTLSFKPTENYCYIPEFGRYYFIENVEVIRTGVFSVSCTVDVLMSYQNEIQNTMIIPVKSSENTDLYYPDSNRPLKQYTRMQTRAIGAPFNYYANTIIQTMG